MKNVAGIYGMRSPLIIGGFLSRNKVLSQINNMGLLLRNDVELALRFLGLYMIKKRLILFQHVFNYIRSGDNPHQSILCIHYW
jgi:hypothetical protein